MISSRFKMRGTGVVQGRRRGAYGYLCVIRIDGKYRKRRPEDGVAYQLRSSPWHFSPYVELHQKLKRKTMFPRSCVQRITVKKVSQQPVYSFLLVRWNVSTNVDQIMSASNNYDQSDKDIKSCKILSTGLSEIIKHSTNDEFRNRCFEMLKTDNSFDSRAVIVDNLLSIISPNDPNNNSNLKKKQKKKWKINLLHLKMYNTQNKYFLI